MPGFSSAGYLRPSQDIKIVTYSWCQHARACCTRRLVSSRRSRLHPPGWSITQYSHTISSAQKQLPFYSGNCAARAYAHVAPRFLLCMGNPGPYIYIFELNTPTVLMMESLLAYLGVSSSRAPIDVHNDSNRGPPAHCFCCDKQPA